MRKSRRFASVLLAEFPPGGAIGTLSLTLLLALPCCYATPAAAQATGTAVLKVQVRCGMTFTALSWGVPGTRYELREPVEGASVTLREMDSRELARNAGRTGRDGTVAITVKPDTTYRVEIEHPLYKPGTSTATVQGGEQAIEILLMPVGTGASVAILKVRVVGEEEHAPPIPGAKVVVRSMERYSGETHSATTDGTGMATIELRDVQNAKYSISATHDRFLSSSLTIQVNGYAPIDEELMLKHDPRAGKPAESGRVKVLVTGPNGPVADVRIAADRVVSGTTFPWSDLGERGSTDSLGVVTLGLRGEGRYRVWIVSAAGRVEPTARYVVYRRSDGDKEFSVEFQLKEKGEPNPKEDTSGAGALDLTVEVRDSTVFRAITGATVSLLLKGGQRYTSATTSGDGQAQFQGSGGIAFDYAKQGLTVVVTHPDYQKSQTNIAPEDGWTKLRLTHRVELQIDEQARAKRLEEDNRRAVAEREALKAEQQARRKREIGPEVDQLFNALQNLSDRVLRLTRARTLLLSCPTELERLRVSLESDPEVATSQELCNSAQGLVMMIRRSTAMIEQREREVGLVLQECNNLIPNCAGPDQLRIISGKQRDAAQAVQETGVMYEAVESAYVRGLPDLLIGIESTGRTALLKQASETCYSRAIATIDQLNAMIGEGFEPAGEAMRIAEALKRMAEADGALLKQDQKDRIQAYLQRIDALGAMPLANYDARQQKAAMEQANARLVTARESFAAKAARGNCDVQLPSGEYGRAKAARLRMLDTAAAIDEAPRACAARIRQVACEAARLGVQEAIAAGKVQDARRLQEDMRAVGCDMSGLPPIAGSPAPPASSNPANCEARRQAYDAALSAGQLSVAWRVMNEMRSAGCDMTGLPDPARPNPGAAPPPATGSAAALPPSIAGSGVSTSTSTSTPVPGPGAPAGTSTEGVTPTRTLPPSLGGSQPVRGTGPVTSGLPPSVAGSGSSSSGAMGASGSAGTGLPPSIGSSRQASGPASTSTGTTGGRQLPPVSGAGSGNNSTPGKAQPSAAGIPAAPPAGGAYRTNTCAPRGTRWPGYMAFPALGPRNEQQAVTVKLEEDRGAFALYGWGGDRPDRPRVNVQLQMSGETVQMIYGYGGGSGYQFGGTCVVADGKVRFQGTYGPMGSHNVYLFDIVTLEWR